MRLNIRNAFFLLLCGIAFLSLRSYVQAKNEAPKALLATIDLSVDNNYQKFLSTEEVLWRPSSVDFLDENTVLVSFYEEPINGSSQEITHFDVMKIDIVSRQIKNRLRLTTENEISLITPVSDGGFVISVPGKVMKYDGNFNLATSYSVENKGEHGFIGVESVSATPSGDNVLVYSRIEDEDTGHWIWLTAKNLSVGQEISSQGGPARYYAATNAGIKTDWPNQILFSTVGEKILCSKCDAYFITDNIVFIDKTSSYEIKDLSESKIINKGKLPSNALSFTRARSGDRIAFVTGRYEGLFTPWGSTFTGISGEIIVLDWKKNAVVSEIHISKEFENPSAGLKNISVALSADGTKLASLDRQDLKIYLLP